MQNRWIGDKGSTRAEAKEIEGEGEEKRQKVEWKNGKQKTEIVIKIVTLFYRRDNFGMCLADGGDTAVNVKDKRHNENESCKGGL